MADQLTTVSKARLDTVWADCPKADMQAVEQASGCSSQRASGEPKISRADRT